MIRAIIIDDEQEARDLLRIMLVDFFDDIEVVAEANSALEGLKVIQQNNPDVLFLDVQMPHGTGFDLLEAIPKRNFEVIFTTAHQEYALKAIKEEAKDFLVKPIDFDDLEKAIVRIRKIKSSNLQSSPISKIQIPVSGGIKFIDHNEIIRVEGDGNYTTLFLNNNEKLVVSKNMKIIESMLPHNCFFRSHTSHLINLKYIKELSRNDGCFIILSDGSNIPLSRRKKDDFLAIMK